MIKRILLVFSVLSAVLLVMYVVKRNNTNGKADLSIHDTRRVSAQPATSSPSAEANVDVPSISLQTSDFLDKTIKQNARIGIDDVIGRTEKLERSWQDDIENHIEKLKQESLKTSLAQEGVFSNFPFFLSVPVMSPGVVSTADEIANMFLRDRRFAKIVFQVGELPESEASDVLSASMDRYHDLYRKIYAQRKPDATDLEGITVDSGIEGIADLTMKDVKRGMTATFLAACFSGNPLLFEKIVEVMKANPPAKIDFKPRNTFSSLELMEAWDQAQGAYAFAYVNKMDNVTKLVSPEKIIKANIYPYDAPVTEYDKSFRQLNRPLSAEFKPKVVPLIQVQRIGSAKDLALKIRESFLASTPPK